MLSSLFTNIKRSSIKIKNTLNSDDAIVYSGFMLGFIHSCNDKTSFLENPLSSILISYIFGFITSIGASIVSSFVPSRVRVIIPLAIIVSCANHIYNPKKHEFNGFKLTINKVE